VLRPGSRESTASVESARMIRRERAAFGARQKMHCSEVALVAHSLLQHDACARLSALDSSLFDAPLMVSIERADNNSEAQG
jgi:hypothetical protein